MFSNICCPLFLNVGKNPIRCSKCHYDLINQMNSEIVSDPIAGYVFFTPIFWDLRSESVKMRFQIDQSSECVFCNYFLLQIQYSPEIGQTWDARKWYVSMHVICYLSPSSYLFNLCLLTIANFVGRCELVFENCFVPNENILGQEGKGLQFLLEYFLIHRRVYKTDCIMLHIKICCNSIDQLTFLESSSFLFENFFKEIIGRLEFSPKCDYIYQFYLKCTINYKYI